MSPLILYNRLEDYLTPLDILELLPYFKTIVLQKDSEFTELFNRQILKMQGRANEKITLILRQVLIQRYPKKDLEIKDD